MKKVRTKEEIEAGKQKRLKNLIPAEKGNNGYGGGRPKGSIDLKKKFIKYLAETDPASGKRLMDLLVENMTKRGINKGGRDAELILKIYGEGVEKEGSSTAIGLKETIEGLSDEKKKMLAEIELERRKKNQGHGTPDL